MATVKYDVSDVESGGGGVEPQPGLYPGKIVSVTHRTKKNDNTPVNDFEVVVDIGAEYVRLWSYIKLPGDPSYDNSKWKLREFTDALDLPPKGSIDPKKLEGKPVMVKTKMRRDDPERAEIKNLFKPGMESVKPDEAEALAEDQDYSTWSIEDLEAEISDRNLEMPAGRKTVAKLAAVLEEDDAATDGAQADGDGGGGDGEFNIVDVEGYEDFDEWSTDDLKEELNTREIKLSGRFSEAKAREAIIEAVAAEAEGEGGEDDGGDDAPPDDEYDQFTDQELKDEIKERVDGGAEISISGRWTRDKAIEALRADDEANPF